VESARDASGTFTSHLSAKCIWQRTTVAMAAPVAIMNFSYTHPSRYYFSSARRIHQLRCSVSIRFCVQDLKLPVSRSRNCMKVFWRKRLGALLRFFCSRLALLSINPNRVISIPFVTSSMRRQKERETETEGGEGEKGREKGGQNKGDIFYRTIRNDIMDSSIKLIASRRILS